MIDNEKDKPTKPGTPEPPVRPQPAPAPTPQDDPETDPGHVNPPGKKP
jgi:hypothetical protein